jgi:transmembrane sensor
VANDEKADAVRAAAHWFAVLSADDVGEQEHLRWQRWLAADPSHHAAWQRVQALQQRFADLPGQVDRRIASHALRRAVEGRRRTLKTLAGLATLAGTGGAAAWLAAGTADWEPWAGDQRTGTGERRRFALADGTQAWLNTASAVALDDDSGRRGLRLMRGELLIAAGADARQPRRPLEVATAEGRVSASRAARFDVYRDAGCCRVTVFEGTVDVLPAATPLGASVSAGRQLVFDRAGVGAVGVAQATCSGT